MPLKKISHYTGDGNEKAWLINQKIYIDQCNQERADEVFCTEQERVGTCYHEFQKGKFNGVDFWKADSLLIHDDVHISIRLEKVLSAAIEKYDPFGIIEITRPEWDMIYRQAMSLGGEAKEAILEASPWAESTLQEYGIFTILGI